jgi:hypothetical protein
MFNESVLLPETYTDTILGSCWGDINQGICSQFQLQKLICYTDGWEELLTVGYLLCFSFIGRRAEQ